MAASYASGESAVTKTWVNRIGLTGVMDSDGTDGRLQAEESENMQGYDAAHEWGMEMVPACRTGQRVLGVRG